MKNIEFKLPKVIYTIRKNRDLYYLYIAIDNKKYAPFVKDILDGEFTWKEIQYCICCLVRDYFEDLIKRMVKLI